MGVDVRINVDVDVRINVDVDVRINGRGREN